MKHNVKFFFLCSVFFSILMVRAEHKISSYDPLIVVVLMVKDEEHVMAATLQPYVDGGITSYLILDTGSTDRTIEVTREFFHQHHITHFYIEQKPFVDFATSRNHAFEYAEQRFPDACFMLMVDAEWFMHNVKALISYCEKQVHGIAECYYIRLITKELDYYLPRMVRAGCGMHYKGVVHETIDSHMSDKVPADIWFEVSPTKYGEEKTAKRLIRDRDALLKYLEKFPNSSRDIFYLAQTFSCLKDYENAYSYYLKRTQMEGWAEETYMAWYRLGEMADIKSSEGDYDIWWPKALEYYLKAYSLCPWRIEPLVRLSYHYYKRKDFTSAYIFARIAFDIPYPVYDILFIEKDFYSFYRYDLLSQCALSVGALEIGELATRKAIEGDPEKAHLYRNLAIYLDLVKTAKEKRADARFNDYKNISPSELKV